MLINKTRKKILTKNIKICKNIFSMGFGLMLRSKNSVKDKAWIFVFSRTGRLSLSITTHFMLFPIDIIFLDSKKKIIDVKENLKPWKCYVPKADSQYVIELEQGTVKKTKTKIGDILKF